MMDRIAVSESEGSMKLRPVIESLSGETMRLNRAGLVSAEELEAILFFLQDMRERLSFLERAEVHAGPGAIRQGAFIELSGMAKLLHADLEIVRSRAAA